VGGTSGSVHCVSEELENVIPTSRANELQVLIELRVNTLVNS